MRRTLFPAKSAPSPASFSASHLAWVVLGRRFLASWPMLPASSSSIASAPFCRSSACSPHFFRTWSHFVSRVRPAPDVLLATTNAHQQVGNSLLAQPVGALYTHDVVSRFLKCVRGDGEAVFRQRRDVAIRLRPCGSAVAEGPVFLPVRGAERSNFEGDSRSRSDAHRRPVCGLNGRRCLLRMLGIEHIDCLEVVVCATAFIGNFEDLAVRAGPRVGPLNSR